MQMRPESSGVRMQCMLMYELLERVSMCACNRRAVADFACTLRTDSGRQIRKEPSC